MQRRVAALAVAHHAEGGVARGLGCESVRELVVAPVLARVGEAALRRAEIAVGPGVAARAVAVAEHQARIRDDGRAVVAGRERNGAADGESGDAAGRGRDAAGRRRERPRRDGESVRAGEHAQVVGVLHAHGPELQRRAQTGGGEPPGVEPEGEGPAVRRSGGHARRVDAREPGHRPGPAELVMGPHLRRDLHAPGVGEAIGVDVEAQPPRVLHGGGRRTGQLQQGLRHLEGHAGGAQEARAAASALEVDARRVPARESGGHPRAEAPVARSAVAAQAVVEELDPRVEAGPLDRGRGSLDAAGGRALTLHLRDEMEAAIGEERVGVDVRGRDETRGVADDEDRGRGPVSTARDEPDRRRPGRRDVEVEPLDVLAAEVRGEQLVLARLDGSGFAVDEALDLERRGVEGLDGDAQRSGRHWELLLCRPDALACALPLQPEDRSVRSNGALAGVGQAQRSVEQVGRRGCDLSRKKGLARCGLCGRGRRDERRGGDEGEREGGSRHGCHLVGARSMLTAHRLFARKTPHGRLGAAILTGPSPSKMRRNSARVVRSLHDCA